MDINQYIQQLDSAIADIEANFTKQLLIGANDTAARIALRVREKSIDDKGVKFGQYSKTKLPAFFYFDTATRAKKGLNEIKKAAKDGEKLSYYDFRKLIGKSNQNKNFELSGDMWTRFGVKSQQGSNTVILGGRTQDSQKKIDWNSTREGRNIIGVSESEQEALADRLTNYILATLRKYQLV